MALLEETKPFWASKTIWGSLATIGSSIGAAIYSFQTGDIGTSLAVLVSILGGLASLFGRISATSKISTSISNVINITDKVADSYVQTRKNDVLEKKDPPLLIVPEAKGS